MMKTSPRRWRGGGDTAMTGGTQAPAPGRVISVQPSSHQISADHRPMVSHSGRTVTATALMMWAIHQVALAHRISGQYRRPEPRPVRARVAAFGAGALRQARTRLACAASTSGRRRVWTTRLATCSRGTRRHRTPPIQFVAAMSGNAPAQPDLIPFNRPIG
jgi:hypothetical protein